MRRIWLRHPPVGVSQMCWIAPGPSMSARTCSSPAGILTYGADLPALAEAGRGVRRDAFGGHAAPAPLARRVLRADRSCLGVGQPPHVAEPDPQPVPCAGRHRDPPPRSSRRVRDGRIELVRTISLGGSTTRCGGRPRSAPSSSSPAAPADLGGRLSHDGDGGLQQLGGRRVVEAHETDIARHPEVERVQGPDRPEGHQVVGDEQTRRVARADRTTRAPPAHRPPRGRRNHGDVGTRSASIGSVVGAATAITTPATRSRIAMSTYPASLPGSSSELPSTRP